MKNAATATRVVEVIGDGVVDSAIISVCLFEALDRDISNEEEKQPVYCFYDDENMQKSNVMDALNKAVRFCSAYKIT